MPDKEELKAWELLEWIDRIEDEISEKEAQKYDLLQYFESICDFMS